MYRIKLQSGEESEFNSFEELCFGIVSGIIGPDDEIYHARAAKWLPIETHPDYKKAAAQAPPPSPAMASQSSAPPPGEIASHQPPEAEAGQDLMTLLDLEELTAFDPGKVQESAPLREAEKEAETGEIEPIEAHEPDQLETNGQAISGGSEVKEADYEGATGLEEGGLAAELDAGDGDDGEVYDEPEVQSNAVLEVEEPVAEKDAQVEPDEAEAAELSSDDEQLAEESATAELEINEETELDAETELDDGEETPMAALELPADEVNDDFIADEAEPEETDPDLDEVDGAVSETTGATQDIDYVAEEDQDEVPMMVAPVAEPVAQEEDDANGDVGGVDDGLDALVEENTEGAQDIDYIAAEDDDDLPMMESVVADADVAEDEDIAEVEGDDDEEGVVEGPAMDAEPHAEDTAFDDTDDVEEDEPAGESMVEATLEVRGEVVEAASDPGSDDIDASGADEEPEVERVAKAGDRAGDDEEALLGGPVVEVDRRLEDEERYAEEDDELEHQEELLATAEVAGPVDAFQPAVDDDPFRDTFSPPPELDTPRRFPVLPVAIAAGVVVMAALGWILMGASGSDEPGEVTIPETPAVVPAPNPDLNQQSLAAEDPSEDVQRRYDEAYDQAKSRLTADLRRAGFASVFAPANFSDEESMISARATIAGASLAAAAYASLEQAIAEDFPNADPTDRESRAHREMGEDLLAVSGAIYDLLLANTGAYAIRGGAMTITKPAVEAEYTRLLGELNRLMALAATADEEQATVRHIGAAIGRTRPPALAELAPPPVLPTDL